MHYYDCPCDQCRRSAPVDTLFQRVLDVIERLEQQLEAPPARECDAALAWLGRLCGGLGAVAALDATPIADAPALPGGPRPEEVRALLDAVAAEFFDMETALAFHRALAAVWAAEPGLVTGPASAAYVAAGLAWTVGEANGLVGPGHRVTAARLKRHLDTVSPPAVHARPFQRALREEWPWPAPPAPAAGSREPGLLALGRTDLLLGRTRGRLIRVRDHALADRAALRAA